MAFKMNRPGMIDISYNKEKNRVSPLHKETDPDKKKARQKGKEAGLQEAKGARQKGKEVIEFQNTLKRNNIDRKSLRPEEKQKTKQAMSAVKGKLKPKARTVNTIKSKDVVKSSSNEIKASKQTSKEKKKTMSGADALKKAKQARSDKKKNKKSSNKNARKQDRADKIMSKL